MEKTLDGKTYTNSKPESEVKVINMNLFNSKSKFCLAQVIRNARFWFCETKKILQLQIKWLQISFLWMVMLMVFIFDGKLAISSLRKSFLIPFLAFA